jgi:hydroxymethylbilane synthase
LRVAAERAVSRAMGGSCSMPLAAFATLSADYLLINAVWGDPEGQVKLVRAQAGGAIGSREEAVALGEQVATELKASVAKAGGSLTVGSAPDAA